MNKKKLRAILLLLLIIPSAAFAQDADLTMKPAGKKKYNVDLHTLTDVTQSMGGMEMKVNAASNVKAVMEIGEIEPNGDFTVLSTWKEIEISSSAMGKDTTMRAGDLNVVMKTVYDKSGKAIRSERIDGAASTDPTVATIEQLAGNVKLPLLPAKTVRKGDTWLLHTNDTVRAMGSPMAMVVDMEEEYSFAGTVTEDGVEYYRINRSGPAKVSGEATQGGMEMHIEGTGMSEGYSLLDKTTRLPVKMEEKSGMDMNIIISGPQSMAIPATQNTVTTIRFSEAK